MNKYSSYGCHDADDDNEDVDASSNDGINFLYTII